LFDIHKEPERFVTALASCRLITEAELGLNTFIKHNGNGKYIVARDIRIYLEDKRIALQKAIVLGNNLLLRKETPLNGLEVRGKVRLAV